MIPGQRGRDIAPGPVGFGETVEKDDRLATFGAAELDGQSHPGGEADPGELELGHG